MGPYQVALATYMPMANLFVELGDTAQARAALESGDAQKPVSWIAGGVIAAIWIAVVVVLGWVIVR